MQQLADARYGESETIHVRLYFLVSTLFVHKLILITAF